MLIEHLHPKNLYSTQGGYLRMEVVENIHHHHNRLIEKHLKM